MDVEGGECGAVGGMRTYLAGSANIIGMIIEYRPGFPAGSVEAECCEGFVREGGLFRLLHDRHSSSTLRSFVYSEI